MTFNLDQAIKGWRHRMGSAGIRSSETLDELESHLCDELDRQQRSGLSAEKAFDAAIEKIGKPSLLKTEFRKENQIKIMKRILIISTGIIGVLVGMAFVMPAVAQYRHEGAMSNDEPWLFLLGSLLTLAGVSAGVFGLKQRPA